MRILNSILYKTVSKDHHESSRHSVLPLIKLIPGTEGSSVLSTGFLAKVTIPESEAYKINRVLFFSQAIIGVSLIYFCESMYNEYFNFTNESLLLKGLTGLNNSTNFINKSAHLIFSVLTGETLLVDGDTDHSNHSRQLEIFPDLHF